MNITVYVRPLLSRLPLLMLNERTARVGYFIFIVLALVVRVIVAPGLAAVLLAVLYSSIWAPQIVRAARRGRPCSLGRNYIVGTTVGRMLLALCTFRSTKRYLKLTRSTFHLADVLGCPKNVMDVEPRRMSRADSHLMLTKLMPSLGSLGLRAFVGCLHASGSSRAANFIRTRFLPTTTRMLL
jgi:hypothetical protein